MSGHCTHFEWVDDEESDVCCKCGKVFYLMSDIFDEECEGE